MDISYPNKIESQLSAENLRDKNGEFKIKTVNITVKNKIGTSNMISRRENQSNSSVPGLIQKTINYKNISRNGNKNIKFNQNLENNREKNHNFIKSKILEDSDKKNHSRAKSYFTERKYISNFLPQKLESKARLSHSLETKRKTIVRGDKYNNIQITHIISTSKPNLFLTIQFKSSSILDALTISK